MTVRTDTYAFARQAPYLLERARVDAADATVFDGQQDLQCPIRHGSTGALQAPASGTVSILKPGGSAHTTSQAVAITSSVATYSATFAITEVLGEGWTVQWALTMADGEVYTYRQSAYLCEFVPRNNISAADLYIVIPDLRTRIPQYQQETRGDGTGWQPQIDLAYYDLVRHLVKRGRRPWLIREVTGYREWLLHRALMHCIGTVSYGPDSSWAQFRKEAWLAWNAAEGSMSLQYSDENASHYTAGNPTTRLAPVGRPRW